MLQKQGKDRKIEFQGDEKMRHTKLRQITFHVERLKSVVGVGNTSAYQIYTVPGEQLGQMGAIMDPASVTSSNEQHFEPEPVVAAHKERSASWLKRALSGMGIKTR
jgi:hypothetical protein